MRTSGPILPPSGEQHELAFGRHHAVVTEVGATLRSYSVGDVEVLDGFAVGERASAGRGQVLAPWPNRLDDGRYSFEGRDGQAALDEPATRTAIHGLVRWWPWRTVSRAASAVTLACVLPPQPGYPWRLELGVEYRLAADGLTVTASARNGSDAPAPFGVGFHPYLTVGSDVIDVSLLTIPARRRLVTDERGLPSGDQAVAGTAFDFGTRRPVGPTRLDTAYTDLLAGGDGRIRVELDHPDGEPGVTLWADQSFRYLMAFTGDTVQPAARRRRSIAIEPMTCPPNALRSGRHLIRLEPGASWSASWGITPR
jgi:galactose mutarotase-like enzyme